MSGQKGKHARRIYPKKPRSRDIPLFPPQIDLKPFDNVDRKQALKAHGVDKKHWAWISKLWEQHIKSRKFKTMRELPQGAPESPMVFTLLVDTVPAALNKNGGKLKRIRYFFCVAYADGPHCFCKRHEEIQFILNGPVNGQN